MLQKLYYIQPRCFSILIMLLIFNIIFFLFPGYGKSQFLINEFQIYGHIEGSKENMVYLKYYSNIKRKAIDDSCKIINGNFSFKGTISDPAFAFIKLSRDRSIDDQTALVFIEPNIMKIKLRSSPFTVVSLSGSKTYSSYDSLNSKKKLLHERYKQAIQGFAEEKDEKKKDILKMKLIPFYEDLKALDIDFFTTHPQSFVTGFLLQSYYRRLPVDSLMMYYSRMNDVLRESIYGIQLREVIQKQKENIVGQTTYDFRSITYDKKIINLSEFKGRYVILDFWAHWCLPCRKSFPGLIELFNKYHSKGLEIIGVADDDFTQGSWKKAIEKDKIGIWHNILRGLTKNNMQEIDKSQSLYEKFNVNILPTKILVDQERKIIGIYEGTGADDKLEKKLREIFE